jgi:hypothetical protein
LTVELAMPRIARMQQREAARGTKSECAAARGGEKRKNGSEKIAGWSLEETGGALFFFFFFARRMKSE